MTKEETKAYIKAYLDGDAATGDIIPLRSILESAIKYLEPSLPSNLDEAVKKNFETMEVLEHENIFEETHNKIFKAGVEWIAELGQTLESLIWMDEDDKLFIEAFVDENKFKMAENVIIQIRKKQ